jgi:leucyl-tRNA synthetase
MIDDKQRRLELLKQANDLFNSRKIEARINLEIMEIMNETGKKKRDEGKVVSDETIDIISLCMTVISPLLAKIIAENNSKFFDNICNLLNLTGESK